MLFTSQYIHISVLERVHSTFFSNILVCKVFDIFAHTNLLNQYLYKEWNQNEMCFKNLGLTFCSFFMCALCKEPFAQRHRVLKIYRGPGFLAVVWLALSPPPCTAPLVNQQHTWTEKERGGRYWALSRQQESLALYKSLNLLCIKDYTRLTSLCETPLHAVSEQR